MCASSDAAARLPRLSEDRLALSALRALSFLGPKAPQKLLPQVLSRLSDRDVGLRHAAALALGQMAEQVASSKPTAGRLRVEHGREITNERFTFRSMVRRCRCIMMSIEFFSSLIGCMSRCE